VLEISVLGPVQVRRDGVALAIPGGRTGELLIRLALDAGRSVSADRLLDELWSGVPTQRNTLQAKVARLRRALGDPGLIDGSYRLNIDPAHVDALRVLSDAATAARRLDAGDDATARALSAAALNSFGGELLPTAGDWAAPHRAQLEEARATLLETHFAARLRLGEPVITELEAAIATAPYQERLWELLITALYRAGRQADALAAYQRARARLTTDLGLEPGPRLRALERRVLEQDPLLRDATSGNLPSLHVELVGRDAELAELDRLLATRRLVEVLGPGGIGKTALAIAAGRRRPGSVWLARLEEATTADEVFDTVAAALNATGGEAALLERLRASRTLLILDNCEHVLDAAAELIQRLLDAVPGLRVLATSQAALEVDGEALLELAPLGLHAAVELFTRRAARAGQDPTDVCRALDGLPLAIELAAARTRTLSVEEIARRLDDRFGVLSDPASRKPERRRALRAAIGWSYELLFPDDKRGLWALATFAGGASLPAVEAVLTALDVPATIDVMGRLAARSLVIADGERFRLLDSIRAFALEESGGQGLDAHAAWFAAAAAGSTAGVRGARQAEHLEFVRVERANIDAALAWSLAHDPPRALAIATGFGWAWIVLGDHRGAQRLLTALEAAPTAPAAERALALLLASWIEASSGDLEPARRHVDEAAALADDPRAAYHLAYVVSHHGDWAHALELTARAAPRLEDPWDHAANAMFASRAAISAGDVEAAHAAREQVDRWLRVVDDPWMHARREAMLGELARLERRFDDAVAHIARAAATSGRLGFLQTEAYQTTSLGRAQCQAGDYEAGAATLALGIAKAEATGDVRLAALGRVHLGRVLRALGRDDEARAALERAAAFHRTAGGGEQERLGEVLLAALDRDRERLEAVLRASEGDAPVEVFALDALGRHAEADARMAAASHFISERDRTDRARSRTP
jgi:predicted ATPase/DNA-binding SARP family transcriptional activator